MRVRVTLLFILSIVGTCLISHSATAGRYSTRSDDTGGALYPGTNNYNSSAISFWNSCINGSGKFHVDGTEPYSSFSQLGDAPNVEHTFSEARKGMRVKGVAWACSDTLSNRDPSVHGQTIGFFTNHKKFTVKDGNFYFSVNHALDFSKDTNTIYYMGLMHNRIHGDVYGNKTTLLKICLNETNCANGGNGYRYDGSKNNDKEIFKYNGGYINGSANQWSRPEYTINWKSDKSQYGYWADPNEVSALEITVNTNLLLKEIEKKPEAVMDLKNGLKVLKVHVYKCNLGSERSNKGKIEYLEENDFCGSSLAYITYQNGSTFNGGARVKIKTSERGTGWAQTWGAGVDYEPSPSGGNYDKNLKAFYVQREGDESNMKLTLNDKDKDGKPIPFEIDQDSEISFGWNIFRENNGKNDTAQTKGDNNKFKSDGECSDNNSYDKTNCLLPSAYYSSGASYMSNTSKWYIQNNGKKYYLKNGETSPPTNANVIGSANEEIIKRSLSKANNDSDWSDHTIKLDVDNMPIEQTLEICYTVQYYAKTSFRDKPIDDRGYETLNKNDAAHHEHRTACVKVKRSDPPKPCNGTFFPDKNLMYNHRQGQNFARIAVGRNDANYDMLGLISANKTSAKGDENAAGYSWLESTPHSPGNKNAIASLFAKPGDNIRFAHYFCAGADYANPSDDRTKAKFTITGKSTYGGKGYLFDHDDYPDTKVAASDPEQVIFGRGYTPEPIETGEAFPTKSPYLMRWLPMTDSNARYKCETPYGSGVASHLSNFFQIAGFSPYGSSESIANCNNGTSGNGVFSRLAKTSTRNSAINMQYSDVGGTITHSIEWPEAIVQNEGISGNGNYTATAEVKIPYNYVLKPYLDETVSGSIKFGETISAKAYMNTTARKNPIVNGNTAYATHSKPSTIVAIGFVRSSPSESNAAKIAMSTTHYVSADANADKALRKLCEAAAGNEEDVSNCEKASFVNNSSAEETNAVFNRTGLLAGNNKETLPLTSSEVSYKVPNDNMKLGDIACVSYAVYPADSHNNPAGDLERKSSQDIALSKSAGTGAMWAVAAPVCQSVAIKPSFSVESSGIVTEKGIATSRSVDREGRVYGSWAEYDVRAGGAIANFSSGAATAYERGVSAGFGDALAEYGLSWSTLRNDGLRNAAGLIGRYGTANRKGQSGLKADNNLPCTTNFQTIANSSCSSSTPGLANLSAVYSQIEPLAERLGSLYKTDKVTSPVSANTVTNGVSAKLDSSSNHWFHLDPKYVGTKIDVSTGEANQVLASNQSKLCSYNKTTHVYEKDASEPYKLGGKHLYDCRPNGAKVYHFDKNVYLGNTPNSSGNIDYTSLMIDSQDDAATSGQLSYRNLTNTIQVDGDLIINSDIILQNANTNSDTFTSLEEIPQLLIFAKNIYITNRVRRIDAWLIAGNDKTPSGMVSSGNNGIVNTCAFNGGYNFRNTGSFGSNVINTVTKIGNFDNCNRTLIINGPVIANRLDLFRTGGAGIPASSVRLANTASLIKPDYLIQRAEIFNLRSDAYLWGFYQSERNASATTTSTQELPVRY
ncbi:hypothetical protein IKF15_02035 [Candidatus Saccharibacteria bacterium]|nr:hypothetical protein [Candidatus Saccharibacteria bacterium]